MVEEVAKATEGFEKADAELTAMKNQPTVEAQLGAMILKRNMKSKRAEQSCIRISHHLLVLWFCPPAFLSLRQSPSLSQSPPHSPPTLSPDTLSSLSSYVPSDSPSPNYQLTACPFTRSR